MFILIVANGYPNYKYPGCGVFEFDQARALANAGQKVVFAAIDLRSLRRWRKWGVEHFIKDGVEVYAINIPLGRVPHGILCCAGKFGLRALYQLIQREHGCPDIVHTHFLNMAEIALILKSKLQAAKFIMTEHWSLVASEKSSYPSWVKKSAESIYASYDKVIAVSPFLANIIQKNFNRDVTCIPNMLDPIFLYDYQRKEHNNFEFVFVGNLNNNKSPLECIQAFHDAFCESNFTTTYGQQIHLRLIGDGPLFHECQERIRELKLENNVCMMGQITRDKIADILRASDCFVLPSKLETFGVAYIEAMACGLPVIATKCGGPEFFINENNGLLIPTCDTPALSQAFKYMLFHIGEYNPSKIILFVNNHFAPRVIASQILENYRDRM